MFNKNNAQFIAMYAKNFMFKDTGKYYIPSFVICITVTVIFNVVYIIILFDFGAVMYNHAMNEEWNVQV
jgi:hypothetical protein